MEKLSLKEKIGYGLGDTACGFIWNATMILLAFFYTDVFGIPAGVMGTLFLVSRLLDAVTDPLMGAWVDRTRTRFGQFRPFLLWGAIPFALVSMATFYTPDFSETGKIIYACVTYISLTLVYTFINVPYCAMPGTLTNDPDERHSLQSIRFFCAAAGGLVISGVALPLVDYIGQGDAQLGYFGAMCTLGVIGAILLIISFKTTRERNHFEKKEDANIRKDFKVLASNSQWRIMCLFKSMATCSNVVRGGATLYFVQYVMNRPELAPQFLLYGSIAAMLGSLLSAKLLAKHDRIKSFKGIIIIYSLLSLALFFAPEEYTTILFAINIIFMFVFNTTTPVQWLMASDIIDHEEHRSGRRLDGLVFSTYLFSLKMGLAIGGALIGWILAFMNYDSSLTTQPDNILMTIKILFCIIPVILYAGMYFMLTLYKLDSKTIKTIAVELEANRSKFSNKNQLESDIDLDSNTVATMK
ncbi:glycoside-pentoside-hexuronide (GPH):cation symporter [Photobacterium sp. ZSDE20]|uniref:Glycoside-pentoside-hexuronide (GPH):cation symporter n=1 Tax=Photobacterium pectinilyticum TaxID=2906793 RepID=A0ABT1N950_9GAMM|nr:glycoside-pentoside-hexuronide (GPH):cation symporter [Photobacterium sp. ZSDE20]MCQ1059784.1 glycoside-pentoside-hexuronide (GPH):cation symporter [Photobacterium sp. ZSDE20]MDD1826159.1 glycoside-pentoside-hexuronide (GPH):cation symporter [Photobacterium sp. ZSDE20]